MGGPFKVEFDQGDIRRIQRALNRIDHIARIQKIQLPWICSVDYKNLLIRNILSQKYAHQYAPYSPRYAQWKIQTMLKGSHFWRLHGDLLNSISSFRIGDGWMAGVPAGIKDSGGKSWFGTRRNPKGKSKPIAMYGRVMEYGLHNHPTRAVFGPTKDEYARSGYSLRRQDSMEKIISGWR